MGHIQMVTMKPPDTCAYGDSWGDLELGVSDGRINRPWRLGPKIENFFVNAAEEVQRVHSEFLKFKAHVLIFLINICILVFSVTALATTARSFEVYQRHRHDLPPSLDDEEFPYQAYVFEASEGREPKVHWPPDQPSWPKAINTDEVKCILSVSTVAIIQATTSITLLVRETAPGLIHFLVVSVMVAGCSVTIPRLGGRGIFRAGIYEADPNVVSTVREWTCAMQKKVGGDDIPYDAICYEQMAATVSFTVAFGLYCVYWIAMAYYLIGKHCQSEKHPRATRYWMADK